MLLPSIHRHFGIAGRGKTSRGPRNHVGTAGEQT